MPRTVLSLSVVAMLAPAAVAVPVALATPAHAVAVAPALVYAADPDEDGSYSLHHAAADGTNASEIADDAKDNVTPALSPDGTKVAYAAAGDDDYYHLFVRNVSGSGSPVQLTTGAYDDVEPAWTPDGSTIAFTRNDDARDRRNIWLVGADGTGLRPLASGLNASSPSWSPSGRQLLVFSEATWSAAVISPGGSRVNVPGATSGFEPVWSPDGTKVAFTRYENTPTGTMSHVAVVPVRGGTPAKVVSDDGVLSGPTWSADGTQLYFELAPRELGSYARVQRVNLDGTGRTTVAGGTSYDAGMPTLTGDRPTDVTAPEAPGGLRAEVGYRSVSLSWQVPTADSTEFEVRRGEAGGEPPASPSEGTVVYRGYLPSAGEVGLVEGATYGYSVFARDGFGNVSPAATIKVQTIGLPSVTTPDVANGRTTTFPISWGAVNAPTAPSGYDVEVGVRRKSSTGHWVGPYWTRLATGTTSTSTTYTGSPGNTYYVRARSVDAFGNRSPWNTTRTVVPFNENYGPNWSSGWTAVNAADRYLGTIRTTTVAGAGLRLTTDATGFWIMGDRCSTCGKFRIYVNGVYRGTFDTYAPRTYQRQLIGWFNWHGIGRASLQVVNLGTPGRPRLHVDGIGAVR